MFMLFTILLVRPSSILLTHNQHMNFFVRMLFYESVKAELAS